MENKTLTDEIYAELLDGLKTGLDWPHFLAKHSASKGPLYNAIGRFFSAIEPKVRVLNEVQEKLDQAGLKLDSLDQRIKEAEGNLVSLEDRRNVLNEQIETLETKLAEKSEFIRQVGELGKLGFDIERLKQLREALTEIGAKHGLKAKEAVSKFFDDLKDYEAVLGAGLLLQGLQTQIETKKLEAEKWQAETEKVERRYKELKETTDAMQALLKRGVKAEQIVSWNNSLTNIGGVEELEKGLGHYKSVQELLAAKRREGKRLDMKLAKANGVVKTLKEQKMGLEGSIRTLRVSALKEIERVGQAGVERIDRVAEAGTTAVGNMGETALGKLKDALSLVDHVSARAIEVGKMLGQVEEKLDKSKEVTEKTTALVSSIEAGR